MDDHSFPCWAPADRWDDCYYYYCCYLLGLLCHAPLESGESLPARLKVGQKLRQGRARMQACYFFRVGEAESRVCSQNTMKVLQNE